MRKVALVAAVLAGLPAAVHAQAQDAPLYREGMPAVLSPADDGMVSAAGFAEAYARAGQPRVVVFWMRRLSDMVAAPDVLVESTVGAVAVGPGGIGYAEGRALIDGALPQPADDRLGERASLLAEAAFTDALRSAGVTLVDRAAIIRLSAEAGDQQAAETAAIAGKADVLVEVTAAGYGAADAMLYRVSAVRTADGRSLGSAVLDPEEVDMVSYEARTGGGYRPVIEPERLGAALARRLLAQLATAW